MNKRPDFTKMSTREVLEYLFDEQENKKRTYEWQSLTDGCQECRRYNAQLFSLDNAPATHPNCRCQLVGDIDGKNVRVSVAELSNKKYEAGLD